MCVGFPPQGTIDCSQKDCHLIVVWFDLDCPLVQFCCMLKLPLREAGATIEVGCLKQIAIQRDRTLEFRFSFGIPLPQ